MLLAKYQFASHQATAFVFHVAFKYPIAIPLIVTTRIPYLPLRSNWIMYLVALFICSSLVIGVTAMSRIVYIVRHQNIRANPSFTIIVSIGF
jgi:hypothetical protein